MVPSLRRRLALAAGGERGAAVIDFVLMSILLVLLLFAVLQVAVYFYARNVAASSAADAARYAAGEGVDVSAGRGRAERLIHEGLDHSDASAIVCTSRAERRRGLPLTVVHCHGRLRLAFSPLASPLPPIDVTSSVLRERRP